MIKISELLQSFPEISFINLVEQKKQNIKNRAGENQNIINQLGNLDVYNNQIGFFDEKWQELQNFINENKDIEINDSEFTKFQWTIKEYSSLVNALKFFKEEIPSLNDIFNSTEYQNFKTNIQPFIQGNPPKKIDLLESQIENILNTLKIKKIELNNNISNNPVIEEFQTIIKELRAINIKELKEGQRIAESIVSKKEINQTQEITEHYWFFEEQARENMSFKIKNFWLKFWETRITSFKIIWLLLSLASWWCIILYVYNIIQEGTTLSVWDSLLRISVLTIAFYFIVYFSKQYSNHKDLYKSYIFKSVSLKVMLWLSEISEKEEKQMIYEKALDKIFSEPNVNNTWKEWEIINIIKDSIPTKAISNLKDN